MNALFNFVHRKDSFVLSTGLPLPGFPPDSPGLREFGIKFSSGGAHISRTIMLAELRALLAAVPTGSDVDSYAEAILVRNVLNKTTESTRQKTLRHLRELYGVDEGIPIFALLRRLHSFDPASLSLVAVQVAWARDPLFRATTAPVIDASEGDLVTTGSLATALESAFQDRYSELNRDKVARNAASSWTQSGHLAGRAKKIRHQIKPTAAAVAMALFFGSVAGYEGVSVFSNPWCRLLDLAGDRARTMGQEAHRAGLLTLRAVGEVVDLTFPALSEFQPATP